MNRLRKKPSGRAGEVSLRVLFVGAGICIALYLYSQPRSGPTPAPLVVEATPVPATPPPATPAPAPVVVEEAPPPPATPEPVVVEVAPPPLDLATVERTPALWPKQVALLQPVVFPIMVNGRPAGSATVPAGTVVRLHRIAGQQVDVEYKFVRQFIPATATDLMPRALAAHKAAEAAAAASATASAEPAPGLPPASEPVPTHAIPAVGKVPELRVQVSVGTSQRRSGDSSYMKEQTIKPKCLIAGASQMTGLPALEATMIVVTMGTKAKYVAGDESYYVQTAEKKSIEPAVNGSPRTFAFSESSVRFDSWRDSTNVGGRVYKYYVFGLTDPATKELVAFQTNCPELVTHCKKNPDKRHGILRLASGASFPAKF